MNLPLRPAPASISGMHRIFLRLLGMLALAWFAPADAPGAAPAPSPLPPSPPRPGGDAAPTDVGFAVWIGDVTHIDSAEQTFTANFLLVLRWRDPQLAHEGPGAKRYALDDIWHPALLILNEAGDTTRSLPEEAAVTPDGVVTMRQRLVGSFSQSLDLRNFPFDRDTLRIRFALPGQHPSDVRFAPEPGAIAAGLRDGVGVAEKLTMQDWRITRVNSRVEPFHASPQIELASFSVELDATRHTSHFWIKVLIPLVLIVMMSWAVFWIEPTDASTQMGVAVTAMLTLIAYRFAIDGEVPRLPYLTRLDAFVLTSTVLVFLSIIEVLVTTKLASMGRSPLARRIDTHSRWVFPLVFASACVMTLLR